MCTRLDGSHPWIWDLCSSATILTRELANKHPRFLIHLCAFNIIDHVVDYIALLELIGEGSRDETPEEKFDSLDINGDGHVDEYELSKAGNFSTADQPRPKTANVIEDDDSDQD